ncbi:MAG TPA: YceI family protein [Ignavibacteriales bacterium]|nr:YceI family protein [Ignavibacteriales bacterium]
MKRLALILIALVYAAPLLATEYNVDKSKKNSVKFISDAPIEDFEGVTDNIDGYLIYEGEDVANGSSLYFETDLRTIDTGIGLRNRHMRENYLETDKYPMAQYKGKITKAVKKPNGEYEVETDGEMTIHGVTRNMKSKGTIINQGDGLKIRTNFPIKLSDYKIDIPQVMFMKINEEMKLELIFHLKKVK